MIKCPIHLQKRISLGQSRKKMAIPGNNLPKSLKSYSPSPEYLAACTRDDQSSPSASIRQRKWGLRRNSALIPRPAETGLRGAPLEIIKQVLESGENVLISGFGKFQVKYKRQRRGRNPATNKDLMLPPRRVVIFRCSGKLRDRINK